MSPLAITVILVFAAGVVGFFFGCLFARWLNDTPGAGDAATLPFKMDLALIKATPTGLDPSTSVMPIKPQAAVSEPPTPAPPSTTAPQSTAAVAAAALADKTAAPIRSSAQISPSMPPPQDQVAPPAPPPATDQIAAPPVASAPSTAAGSANPAITPLRGPLAVARAGSKGGEGDKPKPEKTPRRQKNDKKPAAKKVQKSRISISVAKSKPAARARSAGTAKTAAATKKTGTSAAAKSPAILPGETRAKKPRFMPKPRKSGPDDLKRIKGVGPALEATLNTLGVFHYNQISKWTPENVMWVDDNLKFKGRIARDNWLDQADKLHAGEVTEFAARVDKGVVASSKGKPRRKA